MRQRKYKKIIREFGLIIISAGFIILIFNVVSAGSLTPASAPAATFKPLNNIYDPLASTSYDSSAVTGNPNGNALEIMKCAIQKIRTGSCP